VTERDDLPDVVLTLREIKALYDLAIRREDFERAFELAELALRANDDRDHSAEQGLLTLHDEAFERDDFRQADVFANLLLGQFDDQEARP
jgi:hypothetical protein